MKPFIIIANPRSMTAWVANWFTQEETFCYHEGQILYKNIKTLFQNKNQLGDCTSNVINLQEDLLKYRKVIKIGYIERDEKTCLESFNKVMPNCENNFHINKEAIDAVLRNVEHKRIKFEDILDAEKFSQFHNYLTPHIPFDITRHSMLKYLRITQKIEEVKRDFYTL